jgi:hypothetical protein
VAGFSCQTARKQQLVFPLRDRAWAADPASPSKITRAQGMPDGGLARGPPAVKKAGGSHPIHGSSGIPCTMVLTLITRSPRQPGFVAPVVARLVTARLGLSVGRPGPHAFASALAPSVRAKTSRASPTRPPHPAFNVRVDREASLFVRAGWRTSASDFWKTSSQFLINRIQYRAKLARRANAPLKARRYGGRI